jgi:SPP1 gp7 family putative phage head morphogenesis protein
MPLPGEPRTAERLYTAELRRIWGLAQTVVTWGLGPLLEVWPPDVRESKDSARNPRQTKDGQRIKFHDPTTLQWYEALLDSVDKSPRKRRDGCTATRRNRLDEYNPLAPQPRRRPIAAMSDAELQALWPSIDPADLRRHAPWATSREEVIRVAFPGQGLPAENAAIEDFVRRSIQVSQQSPWSAPDEADLGEVRGPGPGAFRLQPRFQVPVVIGANGLPVPPPPLPTVVNVTTIGRQLDWLKLATTQLVSTSNVEEVIGRAGQRVDRNVVRTLRTLIPIDIRQAVPGLQFQIDQWRDINVGLIESGILAEKTPRPHLRSLLADVSETVEQAHRQGVRVEVLAQDLVDRYGVSNSRAELIAVDQTLSLNAQINRSRQQAAGVQEYTWRATRDARTRKGHRKLNGEVFNWNAPPDTGGSEGHNHPGGAVRCRCQAIPVIRGFVSSGDFVPVEQPRRTRRRRLRPV